MQPPVHVGVFRRIGPRRPRRSPPAASAPRRRCRDRPAAGRAPRARGSGSRARTASTSYIRKLLRRDAQDREQHRRPKNSTTPVRTTAPSTIAGVRKPCSSATKFAKAQSAQNTWRSPSPPASGGTSTSATSCDRLDQHHHRVQPHHQRQRAQQRAHAAEEPPDPHRQHDDHRHHRELHRARRAAAAEDRRGDRVDGARAQQQRGVAEYHADAGDQHRRLEQPPPAAPAAENPPRRRARPQQAVDDQLAPHLRRPQRPRRRRRGRASAADAGDSDDDHRAATRPVAAKPSASARLAAKSRPRSPSAGKPSQASHGSAARPRDLGRDAGQRHRRAPAAPPRAPTRTAPPARARKPPARRRRRAPPDAPPPPGRRRAAAPARHRRRDAPRPPPLTGSSTASAARSRTAFGRLATKKSTQASNRCTSARGSLRPARHLPAIAPRGSRQARPIASTSPARRRAQRPPPRASQAASRSRSSSARPASSISAIASSRKASTSSSSAVRRGIAARGQVEERVLVHRARGRAVAAHHVVGVDLELGLGEELARLVEQQPLADLVAVGLLRPGLHQDLALEHADRRRRAAPS